MKPRLHGYVSLLAFLAGAGLLTVVLGHPAFAAASASHLRILAGGLTVAWLATLSRVGAHRLSSRGFWLSLIPLLPALVWAMIGDTSLPTYKLPADPVTIHREVVEYSLALERYRRAQILGFALNLLGAGASGLLQVWLIRRGEAVS